jgi:hypothetical protein
MSLTTKEKEHFTRRIDDLVARKRDEITSTDLKWFRTIRRRAEAKTLKECDIVEDIKGLQAMEAELTALQTKIEEAERAMIAKVYGFAEIHNIAADDSGTVRHGYRYRPNIPTLRLFPQLPEEARIAMGNILKHFIAKCQCQHPIGVKLRELDIIAAEHRDNILAAGNHKQLQVAWDGLQQALGIVTTPGLRQSRRVGLPEAEDTAQHKEAGDKPKRKRMQKEPV